MKYFIIPIVAALVAGPASAQSYRALNRVHVNPVEAGFEVIESGEFGARGMWCAAADYAQKVLRAPNTTRLYVVDPIGASKTQAGRKGVTFSTDQQGITPQTVSIISQTIKTPGANLTVGHAYQFCADYRLRRS